MTVRPFFFATLKIVLFIWFGSCLLFYLFFIGGRRVRLTDQGIYLGKRYHGPCSLEEEIQGFRMNRFQGVLLPWDNVESIFVGSIHDWWKMHPVHFDFYQSHNETRHETRCAQLLDVPLFKWNLFYLMIRLKNHHYYLMRLTPGMLGHLHRALTPYVSNITMEWGNDQSTTFLAVDAAVTLSH